MVDGPGAKTFFEEQEKASLTTLCKGLIPEMFQREFEQALANALDPNTPFKKRREVRLIVTIQPNDTRDAFRVEATTSSKLASFIGESGTVFAQRRGAQVVAVNYNAEQMVLPLAEPSVRVVKDEAPRKAQKEGTNG